MKKRIKKKLKNKEHHYLNDVCDCGGEISFSSIGEGGFEEETVLKCNKCNSTSFELRKVNNRRFKVFKSRV